MLKFYLSILLLLSSNTLADEWYGIPEFPDSDWEQLVWLKAGSRCEVLTSKSQPAITKLEYSTFIKLTQSQAKGYVGDNCKLPERKYYVLARGLYFCCNGRFGVGKINTDYLVVYSGRGKSNDYNYKRSAVVFSTDELPENIYTGVFISQ